MTMQDLENFINESENNQAFIATALSFFSREVLENKSKFISFGQINEDLTGEDIVNIALKVKQLDEKEASQS